MSDTDVVLAELGALNRRFAKLEKQVRASVPAPLLTRADVAKLLRCSLRTVDTMIKDGRLCPGIVLGKKGRGESQRWTIAMIEKSTGVDFGGPRG